MVYNFSNAEKAAIKVRKEMGINDPTTYSISDMIMGRGAFYEEIPLKNKEGEIVSYNGRSIIQINSEITNEYRKRFAAIHELGHHELHSHLQPIFSDNEQDMLNWYKSGNHEQEANEFASEFLMPTSLFQKECFREKFSPELINKLSERFNVSKIAVILKFIKWGNYPIFFIYSNHNRMSWFKASEDFSYYFEFEKGNFMPDFSLANEIFTERPNGFEAKTKSWKFDWFNERKDERDELIGEYCIYSLNHNYCITVIWEL